MTNKIISSVIALTAFAVLAMTPSHPDSLLFIFISNNNIVATSRLALALAMLAVSFGLISFGRSARKPLLYSGLGLIAAGLISGMATSVVYAMYDYIKLMDIMIIMEAGIILCSAAMLAQDRKLPRRADTKRAAKPRVALGEA